MRLRVRWRRLRRKINLFVWRGSWFDRYVDAMVFIGSIRYRRSEKFKQKWQKDGLNEAQNYKKFYFFIYQEIKDLPWYTKAKIFIYSAILGQKPASQIYQRFL